MFKKKILFISQYFYPENFKGNDLVFELVKQGYEVVVITGKPNYPKGSFYSGYGFLNRNNEIINGAKVYRLPLIPRGKGKGVRIIINYLSFYLSALFYYKFFPFHFKYDVVITQQLSPMTSSLPAIWYKKKRNKPLITWVLDLWPESVISTTRFKKGYFIEKLSFLSKKLYESSDVILVSSKSFLKPISERNINPEKIVYFPNWADEVFELKNCNYQFPKLPIGFNVVFAGNFGEAQDFKSVIQAVKLIEKKEKINFIFVGSGRYESDLRRLIDDSQLKNVYLFPQFPVEYMPSLYAQASVMLLTLKGGDVISNTVPAKLQSYMACSKAVVAMIEGEASEVVQASKCGLVSTAGDYVGLARNIIKLKNMPESELTIMENFSRNYYDEHFTRGQAMKSIINLIEELT
jgi:glycosyltransferase involved in cell wall biosynthesis